MAEPKPRDLAALLLTLTVVTGVVDAVSFLGLGRVFVANMTGNVVFLGFAAAGETTLSVPASLTAVLAFLAGAPAGGAGVAWGGLGVLGGPAGGGPPAPPRGRLRRPPPGDRGPGGAGRGGGRA